jgi:rhodanese-related sulfurtransferase
MAGSGIYEDLTVENYKTRFKDGGETHLLLDVRTEEEYREVRIPGAVNIPLDELYDRIDDVTQTAGNSPIVIVCRSGSRSIMAAQILRFSGVQGVTIYNLDSGTRGWAEKQYPLERDE